MSGATDRFLLSILTLFSLGAGNACGQVRIFRQQLAGYEAGENLRSVVERVRQLTAPKATPVSYVPAKRALPVRSTSAPTVPQAPVAPIDYRRPTIEDRAAHELVTACHYLSTKGYPYVFGGDSPIEGGFDCSGVVKYVLDSLGVANVPRVAYDQYRWLESEGALQKVRSGTSADALYGKLRPGDLMFWTGTYETGRSPNISHVMVYMGRDAQSGEALMFGARSGSLRGRNGNAVDVFPFVYPKKGARGKLVGFGRVPGL